MNKIERQSIKEVSWYKKGPGEPIPVPILGPDLMDPRKFALIKEMTHQPKPDASTPETAEGQS